MEIDHISNDEKPVEFFLGDQCILLLDIESILAQLKDLEILKVLTCRGVYKNHFERLVPKFPTKVFRIDESITVFFEFNNLKIDIPINIELKYKDKTIFNDLSIVLAQNNKKEQYHCTFAYSFLLDGKLSDKQECVDIIITSLSGELLFSEKIIFISQNYNKEYLQSYIQNESKIDFIS